MSASFPPEVCDLVVGHLHNDVKTLKSCCLVSKSWVPRSRTHLFACVEFNFNSKRSIEVWRKLFPNPSESPARHARILKIANSSVLKTAVTSALPWIHPFRHLVELRLSDFILVSKPISVVQLLGLSPALKSLSLCGIYSPLLEVFNFICSFHLLENLELRHNKLEGNIDEWDPPSASPKLTGSLTLDGSCTPIMRGLLCLPGGLHFSKVTVLHPIDGAESMVELASKCSNTLESLCIQHSSSSTFPQVPVADQHSIFVRVI